jgi:hypothetical protein
MSAEKFHRLIMLFSFLICVFIYVDTYWVPLKNSTEIIEAKKYYASVDGHSRPASSVELATDKRNFDVPVEFCQVVNKNDTIVVQSSILTNSVQKAQLNKDGNISTYAIGFVRGMMGFLYLLLVTIGLVILFSLYSYLKNIQGRRSITFVLLICTLSLLFFHIGIDIF